MREAQKRHRRQAVYRQLSASLVGISQIVGIFRLLDLTSDRLTLALARQCGSLEVCSQIRDAIGGVISVMSECTKCLAMALTCNGSHLRGGTLDM